MNAFESVRPKPEPMPPLVRALLESITRRKDNAPRADILAEMAAMPRT